MNSTIAHARSYAREIKRLLKPHGAKHLQSHDIAARTLGARDWRDLVSRDSIGTERELVEARLRAELLAYPEVDINGAVCRLLPPERQNDDSPTRFTQLVAHRLTEMGTPIANAVHHITVVGDPCDFDVNNLRPTTWIENSCFVSRSMFGDRKPLSINQTSRPIAWTGYADMLGDNSSHWSAGKNPSRFGSVTKGAQMTARAMTKAPDDETKVAVIMAALMRSGRLAPGEEIYKHILDLLEAAEIEMESVPRGKKFIPGHNDGVIGRYSDPNLMEKVAEEINELLDRYTVATFIPHTRQGDQLIEITTEMIKAGNAPKKAHSQVDDERTGMKERRGRQIETITDLDSYERNAVALETHPFNSATQDDIVLRLPSAGPRSPNTSGAPWRNYEWRSSRLEPPAVLSTEASEWWTQNVSKMLNGYDHNGHLASVSDVIGAIIKAHPTPGDITARHLNIIRRTLEDLQGWHAKRTLDIALTALTVGPTLHILEINGKRIIISRTVEGAYLDALPPCPQVIAAVNKVLQKTASGRTLANSLEWIGGQHNWTGLRIPGVTGTIVIHEGHRGVEPKALAKAAKLWTDVIVKLSKGMRPVDKAKAQPA